MTDEPIFLLGVGAQKCGTSWLYEQLAAHRDIMMSPIKELHYWDRRFHPDFFKPRDTETILRRLLKQRGDKIISDQAFERVAMDCGEDYYLAYFRSRLRPNHRVLGEISPSYSILSADELAYVRSFLPWRTKAVFLMRDPVERIWSQAKMQAKKATGRGGEGDAYDLFGKSVQRRKYLERTEYTSTVKNLRASFAPEDVFIGFYETLFDDAEVARLATFLGLDDLVFDASANPNKSADLRKPDKAEWDKVRAALAEVYDFVFTEFGDAVPAAWRAA
ncbi:sulfotransferase [Bauldia litoralis]|uniref:Sulfotransferase family protein n=1 Tax=Bauldia litoralis TaxID=665467 RepID=A0A1G6EC97_9HYPH|nr:sulfotransferase [Bauldia litoralis]SDB55099.1 Sulfotransferase family protein [Bauldia litoralis]